MTPQRILESLQLSIILSTITVTALSTFSSTAAPRFDVFSSKLLAWPWSDQQQRPNPVEEVMRSCGGAVQGLRDGGQYLNRANDGFVYMDDGSYSFGPVAIPTTLAHKNGDSKQWMWRHCFMLSSEERIICDLRWDNPKGTGDEDFFRHAKDEPSVEALLLASLGEASRRLHCASSLQSIGPEEADSKTAAAIPSVTVRCRMSSPSQPWNIQRVKWESTCGSHSRENDNTEDMFASYTLTESPSSLVLACHVAWNGSRKSIARHYGIANGVLQQVAFQYAL